MSATATPQQGERFAHELGLRLIASEKLDEAALDRVRRLRAASGERLVALLTKLGMVSERDLAALLSEVLDLAPAAAADYPETALLEDRVNVQFLREARAVPMDESADALTIAMADPSDIDAVASIAFLAGKPIIVKVATPAEIETQIDRLYGGKSRMDQIVESAGADGDDGIEDIERLKDLASEAPVVRLVNMLINRAAELRASDIHIEPAEGRIAVRYRIDGVLAEMEAPPARLRAALLSRIKIMAGLNIAERRLPQDGRIRQTVQGKDIDLRVSVVPTLHGEAIVLRLLDRGSVGLTFASLGLGGTTLQTYLKALDQPHGVLLVTGPTGSGKTTTLYASLTHLNSRERKIFTVEDPVEYQLSGVNQIPVKPQIGLDFAKVLRAILRQDPDIIMIGEIRDRETAEIAVQSALTGHLVLSTLHTNDAASSLTRLLDMGIEDYLLTSTINGIAAQRLVRQVCPACREAYEPIPELADHLGLRSPASEPVLLYRARGCEACGGTGYAGRTSLMEVLAMSDGIRQVILSRAAAHDIHRAAVEEGMETLYDNGLRMALSGATTLEEVLRVTRDR